MFRFQLPFSKTCESGEDASTSPEGLEQMQSLRSIDNFAASHFPLQFLFECATHCSCILAKYYHLPV